MSREGRRNEEGKGVSSLTLLFEGSYKFVIGVYDSSWQMIKFNDPAVTFTVPAPNSVTFSAHYVSQSIVAAGTSNTLSFTTYSPYNFTGNIMYDLDFLLDHIFNFIYFIVFI